MPEDRWLWGQPKTWHEMNRALADVSILLEYMGQLPDGRLQAYFEDTQSKIVTTGARRTAAPCRHYGHFLARLVGTIKQASLPYQSHVSAVSQRRRSIDCSS